MAGSTASLKPDNDFEKRKRPLKSFRTFLAYSESLAIAYTFLSCSVVKSSILHSVHPLQFLTEEVIL